MEKQYKLGDKLPECLLSDKDWKTLKMLFDAKERPLSAEDRKELINFFDILAAKYCVGANKSKCLLCSKEQHHHSGLCDKCLRAARQGVLRHCGNVKGNMTHKDLICLARGAKGTTSKGLCRKCYYMYTKYGFNSIEEMKESKPFIRRMVGCEEEKSISKKQFLKRRR